MEESLSHNAGALGVAEGTRTERLMVRDPNMFLTWSSWLNSTRQKVHVGVTRENAGSSTISRPFCKDQMNNQQQKTSWTTRNRMEEVVRVKTHPESTPVTAKASLKSIILLRCNPAFPWRWFYGRLHASNLCFFGKPALKQKSEQWHFL